MKREEFQGTHQLIEDLTLDSVLDRFINEIKKNTEIENIALYLKKNKNLILYKNCLPVELKDLEKNCLHSHFEINNFKSFSECIFSKTIFHFNPNYFSDLNLDPALRKQFEAWKYKDACHMPLYKGSLDVIGLITLTKQDSLISEKEIAVISHLIDVFYYYIKYAFIIEEAIEKRKEFDSIEKKYHQLLDIFSSINKLLEPKKIFQNLIEQFIRIFKFDLGFVQLEQNGKLPILTGFANSEKNNQILENELNYFGNIQNAPLIKGEFGPEMANCYSYLNNTHFYFPDNSNIKKIGMLAKDLTALELAGAPLVSLLMMPVRNNNIPIGILQLWTMESKVVLTAADIEIIGNICSFVPSIIDNVQIHKKVETQKKEIEEKNKIIRKKNNQYMEDLKLAKQIQQKLIPLKPSYPGIQFATTYLPMDDIGGDFFDFVKIPVTDDLGIFISDVSGHGVPAALITSMVKTLIEISGAEKHSPNALLSFMNDKICGQTNGNFLTAFYGIYHSRTKILKYARGAHNYPILIRKNQLTALSSQGKILGIEQNLNFEEKEIQLQSKDRLLFYTDGLTESTNPQGIEFEEKLYELLKETNDLDVHKLMNKIYLELIQHREEYKFDDDICMILMEIE